MGEMGEDVEVIVDGKVQGINKTAADLGIDTSTIMWGINATECICGLTDAKSYVIVSEGDKRLYEQGYITESDLRRIVRIAAHEAGCTPNAATDMFGIVSVVLNEYEHPGFYDCMGYTKNTFTEFLDGFCDLNASVNKDNDGTRDSTVMATAEEIVRYTLSGTRAFGSEITYWAGNLQGAYSGQVTGFSNNAMCDKHGINVDVTHGVAWDK